VKHLNKALAFATVAWATSAGLPALVLLSTAAYAAPATEVSQASPQDMISDVSTRLFAALDAQRAALRKNPEAINPIVDEILLPHFDAEYATQLVLARHWSDASAEQRRQFIEAFHSALLRTYGSALTNVTADRMRVLPYRGAPDATQATVHTEVIRDGGGVVHVDYRLRKTAEGWKAFDVIIEGISYVRSYRTDLDSEIAAKGLDAVIARMEKQTLRSS
jgi:phospholipid transport system substrate-binding protein